MDNIIYINTIIPPKDTNTVITMIIIVMAAIIIPLVFLTFGIIDSMRNTTLALTENELIIKSLFYGRKVPIENIFIDEIKQIDLDVNTEYAATLRLNGIFVPQFRSGWMRLKNKEKALVFITDKNNVVLIPTKEYLILFSMSNIDEFINKITMSTR